MGRSVNWSKLLSVWDCGWDADGVIIGSLPAARVYFPFGIEIRRLFRHLRDGKTPDSGFGIGQLQGTLTLLRNSYDGYSTSNRHSGTRIFFDHW